MQYRLPTWVWLGPLMNPLWSTFIFFLFFSSWELIILGIEVHLVLCTTYSSPTCYRLGPYKALLIVLYTLPPIQPLNSRRFNPSVSCRFTARLACGCLYCAFTGRDRSPRRFYGWTCLLVSTLQSRGLTAVLLAALSTWVIWLAWSDWITLWGVLNVCDSRLVYGEILLTDCVPTEREREL